MIQTISIKDTRKNLADLINQVDVAGKQFIISKFGKPKAMIVPFKASVQKKSTAGIHAAFGAWADRTDIKDSGAYVDKIRNEWSNRNK